MTTVGRIECTSRLYSGSTLLLPPALLSLLSLRVVLPTELLRLRDPLGREELEREALAMAVKEDGLGIGDLKSCICRFWGEEEDEGGGLTRISWV